MLLESFSGREVFIINRQEFKIERAANKDFNDDLREKKGIVFEPKPREQAKIDNSQDLKI